MGLKPVVHSTWLPQPIDMDERARKATLLAAAVPAVFAAQEGSEAAQHCVLERVLARHGALMPPASELPPLARAALYVPEDLCVMQPSGAAYRLTAACVCAPSYWSLAQKIGRTLAEIHAPVRGLEAKIGPAMSAFLARIPPATVFERRNWFLHRNAERFQPAAEDWQAAGAIDARTLVMRSERQTFARLADDLVLFTIDVRCRPLAEIARYPQAARDLLAAYAGLDDDERAATGYRYFGRPLQAYLEQIAAAA
jgi:dimethylamine monooxygenase subunit A